MMDEDIPGELERITITWKKETVRQCQEKNE
jgi:hypothetical protein